MHQNTYTPARKANRVLQFKNHYVVPAPGGWWSGNEDSSANTGSTGGSPSASEASPIPGES